MSFGKLRVDCKEKGRGPFFAVSKILQQMGLKMPFLKAMSRNAEADWQVAMLLGFSLILSMRHG
jgi:hypothetical protein